jgi:CxxC motif-containing protein (DUF1111 family)
VRAGASRFAKLGCESCHTQTQRSGPNSVAVLASQEFHPTPDLLLHDMGAGLADGRPDFLASGTEWRTPPLWGIGLIDDVNGHRFPAARRTGPNHRRGDSLARWRSGAVDASVPILVR